ncbi:MAG: hypothetical protein JNL23_00440 [Chitinophagaceae bacterium]|nr:hypothetical protein [Chitinophagaceae bacterium]
MKNGRLIVFTIILVALATACKFFFGPNLSWSGFSPVIAIALFSGFVIRQKDISFLLPLIALLLSDAAIQLLYEKGAFPYPGFYSGQLKNYIILLSATVIGWLLKGRSTVSIATGAVAAPTVFFLLSNFSVWLSQEVLYPKTFGGLMQSYANGLPFYRNALIATVVFLPLILITYNYLIKSKPVLALAKA